MSAAAPCACTSRQCLENRQGLTHIVVLLRRVINEDVAAALALAALLSLAPPAAFARLDGPLTGRLLLVRRLVAAAGAGLAFKKQQDWSSGTLLLTPAVQVAAAQCPRMLGHRNRHHVGRRSCQQVEGSGV